MRSLLFIACFIQLLSISLIIEACHEAVSARIPAQKEDQRGVVWRPRIALADTTNTHDVFVAASLDHEKVDSYCVSNTLQHFKENRGEDATPVKVWKSRIPFNDPTKRDGLSDVVHVKCGVPPDAAETVEERIPTRKQKPRLSFRDLEINDGFGYCSEVKEVEANIDSETSSRFVPLQDDGIGRDSNDSKRSSSITKAGNLAVNYEDMILRAANRVANNIGRSNLDTLKSIYCRDANVDHGTLLREGSLHVPFLEGPVEYKISIQKLSKSPRRSSLVITNSAAALTIGQRDAQILFGLLLLASIIVTYGTVFWAFS